MMTEEQRKHNVKLLLNETFNWGYTRGYIVCGTEHDLSFIKKENKGRFSYDE